MTHVNCRTAYYVVSHTFVNEETTVTHRESFTPGKRNMKAFKLVQFQTLQTSINLEKYGFQINRKKDCSLLWGMYFLTNNNYMTNLLHPQVESKKNWMNEWMLRKATKVQPYVPSLLTPQVNTVVIEVSSVKGLSLGGNPMRLYRAKHLPMVTQDFTLAKLAILT